jgi:hypothetical protein
MKIITKMIKLFENNVVLAKKFTINKLYVWQLINMFSKPNYLSLFFINNFPFYILVFNIKCKPDVAYKCIKCTSIQ